MPPLQWSQWLNWVFYEAVLQEFLSMPEYLISKISFIPTINSGPRQIMGLITLHNDTNCTEDNTYYLNILQLGHLYLTLEFLPKSFRIYNIYHIKTFKALWTKSLSYWLLYFVFVNDLLQGLQKYLWWKLNIYCLYLQGCGGGKGNLEYIQL